MALVIDLTLATSPEVEQLIRDAVAAEREACALLALANKNSSFPTTDPWNVSADFIADAIRRRGATAAMHA